MNENEHKQRKKRQNMCDEEATTATMITETSSIHTFKLQTKQNKSLDMHIHRNVRSSHDSIGNRVKRKLLWLYC